MRRLSDRLPRLVLVSVLVLSELALPASSFAADRMVLVRTAPAYPELAKRMRVEGPIVMMVSVEPDGHVSAVKIATGHPLLGQAAADAVMHWRFAPAAEAETIKITLSFKL